MSIFLDVRLEQYEDPIGYLVSVEDGSTSFTYAEPYLNLPDAMPVSLGLPLRSKPYGDIETRTFFGNLLPENDQLQQVIDREGLARDDIVGLLFHLGADCPGAISCVPDGDEAVKVPGELGKDYDPLDDKELTEIVRRLADREPLPNHVRDPSPIAGVQRKIALTQLANGQLALPRPGLRVPSTHILKVPRRGRGREAQLETAAAELAAALSLEVAVPQVVRIGEIETILIERFDRSIDSDGKVLRIHQEDFAQALGLPAALKYQRYGRTGRTFDTSSIASLLKKTANPTDSAKTFLISTIFNLAIGNNDNHAKNHALLYDSGASPRIAPLYDLLPVRLDSSVSHELSFKIGTATHADTITKLDFENFFAAFGMSKPAIRRFETNTVAPLLGKLDEISVDLQKASLKDFDDLIGSEIDRLKETFSLPLQIRKRDYFAPKGGGWQLSS